MLKKHVINTTTLTFFIYSFIVTSLFSTHCLMSSESLTSDFSAEDRVRFIQLANTHWRNDQVFSEQLDESANQEIVYFASKYPRFKKAIYNSIRKDMQNIDKKEKCDAKVIPYMLFGLGTGWFTAGVTSINSMNAHDQNTPQEAVTAIQLLIAIPTIIFPTIWCGLGVLACKKQYKDQRRQNAYKANVMALKARLDDACQIEEVEEE